MRDSKYSYTPLFGIKNSKFIIVEFSYTIFFYNDSIEMKVLELILISSADSHVENENK